MMLTLLRQWMEAQGIGAFLIPTADPHGSEYIDAHWQTRATLTGFTGSAGTAVVTLKRAAFWTDSRYFIQAAAQLAGSDFVLMREGEEGTPTIREWLDEEDAGLILWATDETTIGMPESYQPFCVTEQDPFADIWRDRPPLTLRPVEAHPLELAGISVGEKLARLRASLVARYAPEESYAFVMNDLSEIAWTLNLRGSDVSYNPVFHAYLIVLPEGAVLCANGERLTAEAAAQMEAVEVTLAAYDDLAAVIDVLCEDTQTWLLPATMNYRVRQFLEQKGATVLDVESETARWRSIKNAAEAEGFRRAMRRDGVALVRFRRWLDEHIQAGTVGTLTETDIDLRLTALRSEAPEFRSLSFATIAGYGANGAIVHYEAEPDSAAHLAPRGLLLLDSGAQYIDGTTDITRTIALGALTDEERRVYTLVLKGHIALARLRFPDGLSGNQLDTVARAAMWAEGYDYGHGTGHGVGAYLCVHEGPQQIRKDRRPAATAVPFRAGMTITNEPGIYVEGRFGVRIENVLLVVEDRTTPYGRFLRFEDLTLCPIDTAPIDRTLLTEEEAAWLDDYHTRVRSALLPLLMDEADRQWLADATAPLAGKRHDA